MPGSSSQGVFLSYRREDAAPYALLLRSKLRERFPDAQVFMDLDSIELGVPFAKVIRDAVESSAVLVALIGRQWLTLADEEGHRRLDSPDDFVRFEVQTALERGVRVIPVLVDDAKALRQQELPSGLQELAGLNALDLSYSRYDYDAGRLLDLIQRVLAVVRDQEEADRKAQEFRQVADTEIPVVASDDRAGLSALERPTAPADPPAREVRPDAIAGAARKVPELVRNDRTRVARLIDDADAARLIADAERAADSITDKAMQASALTEIAETLAATDPDRADQLLYRAERVAQAITEKETKAEALGNVAEALVATNPGRAENIAQSIADKVVKASALSNIAETLAATDPDRALRITEAITGGPWKATALVNVVGVLAATDPDRAVRAAHSITDENTRSSALIRVAGALAATDPDRAARLIDDAERIAQSITSEPWKAIALADLVRALAATDPDRAARLIDNAEQTVQSNTSDVQSAPAHWFRNALGVQPGRVAQFDDLLHIAQSIARDSWKATALTRVAEALATTDPDHAERIAQSITSEPWKAMALADLVRTLATTDPDHAERIAQSITSEPWRAMALADLVRALATTDPDHAERIAQSITSEPWKASALVRVAEALAATDPDRAARLIGDAERIAQSITDQSAKVEALLKIVNPTAGHRAQAADHLRMSWNLPAGTWTSTL